MLYDLCFAWNWPYDADFAALLSAACQAQGLSLFQVTPANLESALQAVRAGELQFRAFFDRASDDDSCFLPLVAYSRKQKAACVNCFNLARRAWNKAFCHYEFIRAGVNTPRTIILPAYDKEAEFSPPVDLIPLGPHFDIKPAHGGGGAGVITGLTTWDQVQLARQQYPTDEYLLQTHIVPSMLEGREAWFRVIYCDGLIFPCWWNTKTHIYLPVTEEDETRYGLGAIRELMVPIAYIASLELFSTEIAYTAEGLFVVVDYINDPLDLRLQSKAMDGIPDAIVQAVAVQIARSVANEKPVPPTTTP